MRQQEPLQKFLTRLVVDTVQKQASRLAGESEGLARSQLVVEHPWVAEFVANLGPLVEERISISLPDHFVEQVFRLFDADHNGKVTKQEWVAKCNILTTEGREQRINALFTLVDEDSDGLVRADEAQRVFNDVAQLVHEAAPQIVTQVSDILVDRITHLVYHELQIPFGRIIPAERMEAFLLGLRKSLPHDWLSNGLEGLLKESEFNADDLFRRYASLVTVKGEEQHGITADMFERLLQDVLDMDAIFRRFDALLPVSEQDAEIQAQLQSLRRSLQERFTGEGFRISSLIFKALDLDNSGVVDKEELQGFVDLLHHSATYGGSMKANQLAQSYTGAAMAMYNSTLETEVQYVMHVLAKNRRVTLERLKGFVAAWFGLGQNLLLEYVESHTNKAARENELLRIVSAWFSKVSQGKGSMNTRAFATVVGSVVSVFD